jgi:2-polyprenyl-6-methoxyphenol hydroxylase-like FAD-dependent oxidoreductase
MSVGQAVVLGGSIGGIVAARALAEHFKRVIVLERDAETPCDGVRKGVPQGRHAHGLLYRGREVFEELFPGWTDDVVARGGVFGDPGTQGRWIHGGHTMARAPGRSPALLASRPLIEGTLMRHLGKLANVTVRREVDVLGIAADGERVSAVRTRARIDGREDVLEADLVVDALGRGSPTPKWLETMGVAAPAVDEVKIDVHYVTRLFARRPTDLDGDTFVIVGAVPPSRAAGVALAQEGDRFVVTLAGYLGERAPTDLDGFRAHARKLAAPDIADLVDHAEPIGDAVTATYPASRRRRYEKLSRFPEGLLVFGDAIATFNPIYGQGMSVAALEGLALRRCLARGGDRLWRRFFREAAKVVDVPWGTAVLNDLRFDGVEGRRAPFTSTLHRYLDRVYGCGVADPDIARAVLDVVNLAADPSSLMSPRILGRVLFRRVPVSPPIAYAPQTMP